MANSSHYRFAAVLGSWFALMPLVYHLIKDTRYQAPNEAALAPPRSEYLRVLQLCCALDKGKQNHFPVHVMHTGTQTLNEANAVCFRM